MLLTFRKKISGQSTIEFAALIMFVLGAFFIGQKYIVRGFVGRWKATGEVIGAGRIYDPKKTIECAYDYQYSDAWYNLICYEDNCDCLSVRASQATCKNCILSCRTNYCD